MPQQTVFRAVPEMIKDGITQCRNCSEFRTKYSWTVFVLSTVFFTGFNTWFVSTGGLQYLSKAFVAPLLGANLIFYTATLVTNVLWLSGTKYDDSPSYSKNERRKSCASQGCDECWQTGRKCADGDYNDIVKLKRTMRTKLMRSTQPQGPLIYQPPPSRYHAEMKSNFNRIENVQVPASESRPRTSSLNATHSAQTDRCTDTDSFPTTAISAECIRSLSAGGVNARLPTSLCRLVASDPQRLNDIVDIVSKSAAQGTRLDGTKRQFSVSVPEVSAGPLQGDCFREESVPQTLATDKGMESANDKATPSSIPELSRGRLRGGCVTERSVPQTDARDDQLSSIKSASDNLPTPGETSVCCNIKAEKGTSLEKSSAKFKSLMNHNLTRSSSDSKLNLQAYSLNPSGNQKPQAQIFTSDTSSRGNSCKTVKFKTENETPDSFHKSIVKNWGGSETNFPSPRPNEAKQMTHFDSEGNELKPDESGSISKCYTKDLNPYSSKNVIKKEFNRDLKPFLQESEHTSQSLDYIPLSLMKSPYQLKKY